MMLGERAVSIHIILTLAAAAAVLFVYSRHLSGKIDKDKEWYEAATQVRNYGGTITCEYLIDDGATIKHVFNYRKATDED